MWQIKNTFYFNIYRSSPTKVFLQRGVLKIYSKFTGEHSCRSEISVNLLWNFIEITLRYWSSPVNLLHIFRTSFAGITTGGLLLHLRKRRSLSVQVDHNFSHSFFFLQPVFYSKKISCTKLYLPYSSLKSYCK